jgi:predicted anti-sigma-YlaC factor YlaD
MNDQWIDRLSEYLDGDLSEGERITLEAHLQTCSECSAVLTDLRRVVAQAGSLENGSPKRDLWPAIADRIGSTGNATRSLDLSSHRARSRRWSFSLPQLAAAGLALMTLSGGAVWVLRSPAEPGIPITVASRPSGNLQPVNTSVGTRSSATESYATAVADLEQVLANGRGQLDTTTVRVIEQNLAAIDRAIAQAQRALNADPANLYLNTHLAETMRRKLDLLRQAAALVPVS